MKQRGQDMIQVQSVPTPMGNTHHLVYSISPLQQGEAIAEKFPAISSLE